MTSPAPVLDVEALLVPIPGENPSGESLQYSGLYDEIREARRADDEMNQGEWKRELKVADFEQEFDLAADAILKKTKDLQIAAWLAEAVTRLHGFTGCRDALKVLRGLHERFWDTLYPEIDEGDMEARANVMAWFDREISTSLKLAPLTRAAGGAYGFAQYQESRPYDVPGDTGLPPDPDTAGKLSELRQKAEEEKKLSGEEFRKAKNATPRVFYEDLSTCLSECMEEFKGLDKAMDERFARQTPGLGELKKTLADIQIVVERFVKEKRALEPSAAEPGTEAGEAAGGEGMVLVAGVAGTSGPIRSREDALKRLSEVAEFFRRSEPHSPVAYLVDRAVGWGRMPLEAWLVDVIKDTGTLDKIRETLGIRQTE